jgi:hypothetical protein
MTHHQLYVGPLCTCVCVLFFASASVAQASAGASVAQGLTPTPDPGVLPSPAGLRLSLPIRLSLSGNVAPLAPLFPQCQTLEDDAGNSVAGIPVHHYAEWRPLPQLTLSVFSQLGCPIDAGIGALMLYSLPLRDTASLVFSTGMYGAPAQFDLFGGLGSSLRTGLRGAVSPVSSEARVDLSWQGRDGNAYSVGAESVGTTSKRFTFSSGF